MKPDLQAAAERVRRVERGENVLDVYPKWTKQCRGQRVAWMNAKDALRSDRYKLADAYLALSDQEAEPITTKYKIETAPNGITRLSFVDLEGDICTLEDCPTEGAVKLGGFVGWALLSRDMARTLGTLLLRFAATGTIASVEEDADETP